MKQEIKSFKDIRNFLSYIYYEGIKTLSQNFKIGDKTFLFPIPDDSNSRKYLDNAFELYRMLKDEDKTTATKEDLKYFENKHFNDKKINNKTKYENFLKLIKERNFSDDSATNLLISTFQEEIKKNASLRKKLKLKSIKVINCISTNETREYNEAYNEFSKLYNEAIKEKNEFATIIIINMPDHVFSVIITPDQDVIVQNYDYEEENGTPKDKFVDKIEELTKKNGKECENVSFWSEDGKHIAYCFPQTEQFIIEILRRAKNHEGELTMEFFEEVIESLLAKKKLTFKFNSVKNKLEEALAEIQEKIPKEITNERPKQDLYNLEINTKDEIKK